VIDPRRYSSPQQRRRSLLRGPRILLILGLAFAAAIAALVMSRWTQRHAAAGRGAATTDRTSFLTNFQPLNLVDQTGRPFQVAALSGKVVLFNFIFTSCPNVCPVQTQALAEVQRSLPERDRDRVRFVSVSIDPEHDTPRVLHSFAERFKVDFSRWTFVTGGTADIDRLADRLRLFAENKDRRPENHGTTLWLMDGQGRLMQRYAGNPPEVARLVSELDALVKLGT
jgi:protein SCO1/2